MSVTLTKILDPLDRTRNQVELIPWMKGRPLAFYLGGNLPVAKGIRVVIAVNGRVVKENPETVIIQDGDYISVGARIESTLAAFVGSWLATTLFPATGAALMGNVIGYAIAYGVGYGATMLTMGYAMSKVVGLLSPEPSMPGQSSYDKAEQTYGWGDLEQTTTEGTPIMDLYGENRVAGQVLAQYVDIENNKEVLYILLAVCGHQLDSMTDFQVGGQPYNYFRGTSVAFRLGTLNDTVIQGFEDGTPLQKSVKAKLSRSVSVVRTTDGNLVDKLRIIILAPNGMYYANNEGSLDSRSATFTIEYKKSSAGTWTLLGEYTFSGKTNEAIRKKYTISGLDPDQYDMRVTRTSVDDSNSRTMTDLYWMYWHEIISEGFIYPGIAKYAFKGIATEDLSGIKPTFSCLATRNTVQVWNEYLPTPAWDSKSATNPAWISYDRLIRGGKGQDKSRIIWDEWAAFADHNDVDVSGSGDPEEKRNQAGMVFAGGNLWDNSQRAAKLGQGAVVYRGTDFGVFIDKEESVVSHLFTMGNILDETYDLDYMGMDDRANCVEIEYTDPDRDHTRQPISVHSQEYLDSDIISKTAHVPIEASIPRKQAIRTGVRMINSNKYLVRVIKFDAFVDSFGCTVGDLFHFQHDVVDYDGKNIGGRIIDAGNDFYEDPEDPVPWVELDRPVTIETGDSGWTIAVRRADNTIVEKTVDLIRTPKNVERTVLFLASPWISMPDPKDVYSCGVVTSGHLKKYRMIELGFQDDFTASILGVEYIPEIYTDNDGYVIESPTWEQHLQEAIDVMVNEFLGYGPDGSMVSRLNVSWHRAWTDTGGNWQIYLEDLTAETDPVYLGAVYALQYTVTAQLILGHEYRVIVAAGDKGPVLTDSNYEDVTIQGKEAPPSDVTGFGGSWDPIHRAVHFSWDEVTDIDLRRYDIQQGSSWVDGASPVITAPKGQTSATIYIDEGVSEVRTYRIRAVDTSEIESENEAVTTVSIDTSDCPLSVPGDLALVSSSIIASDGRNLVTMLATWNADAELSDDWHHYDLILEDTATNKTSMFSTTDREYRWELIPNKQYGVSVRAVDVSGNRTAWSSQVLHTTVKDTSAPAAPAWPTSGYALPGFKVIGLSWNENSEYDLSHYVLERSEVSDFSSDVTVLGEIKATFHPDANGLNVSTEYFYRLKAVDTSGNESGYSSIKSATTLQIGSTDIALGAIIASHINVTNLAAISASIDGLILGTMQSVDGKFSINLDNKVITSEDDDGNSLELTSADLTFFIDDGGTPVPYKALNRFEQGTAVADGSTYVNIPGVWKNPPFVRVSPAIAPFYTPSASGSTQELICNPGNVELQPGETKKYRFLPVIQSRIGSGSSTRALSTSGSESWMSTSLPYTYVSTAIAMSPTTGVKQINVGVQALGSCYPTLFDWRNLGIRPTLQVYETGVGWVNGVVGATKTSNRTTQTWSLTSATFSGDLTHWRISWYLTGSYPNFGLDWNYTSETKYISSYILQSSGTVLWDATGE